MLSAIALGAALGVPPAAHEPDPAVLAQRQAALHAAASDVELALQAVDRSLAAAIEHGRRGSALTVAGDESPRAAFLAAAREAERASAATGVADRLLDVLSGRLSAIRPGAAPPPSAPSAADLVSIAGQLRASAEAADPFVALRLASERTVASLEDALAAMEQNDPDAALRALADARAALDQVAAWEEPPTVLPLWLSTTGDMLAAARRVAEAAIAGDEEAAELAAAAFRDAAERARQADTALALAISETGAGIAGTPLRRLADAAAATAAGRAAVASVLQASS